MPILNDLFYLSTSFLYTSYIWLDFIIFSDQSLEILGSSSKSITLLESYLLLAIIEKRTKIGHITNEIDAYHYLIGSSK